MTTAVLTYGIILSSPPWRDKSPAEWWIEDILEYPAMSEGENPNAYWAARRKFERAHPRPFRWFRGRKLSPERCSAYPQGSFSVSGKRFGG